MDADIKPGLYILKVGRDELVIEVTMVKQETVTWQFLGEEYESPVASLRGFLREHDPSALNEKGNESP